MNASSKRSMTAISRRGFVLPATTLALGLPKAYGNTWQQQNDHARHRSAL